MASNEGNGLVFSGVAGFGFGVGEGHTEPERVPAALVRGGNYYVSDRSSSVGGLVKYLFYEILEEPRPGMFETRRQAGWYLFKLALFGLLVGAAIFELIFW